VHLQDGRSSGAAEGRVCGGSLPVKTDMAKALLAKNLVDETAAAVGFSGDVVIYGANLMFVDMELVGLYGLDI
jgi:hypothetical protein